MENLHPRNIIYRTKINGNNIKNFSQVNYPINNTKNIKLKKDKLMVEVKDKINHNQIKNKNIRQKAISSKSPSFPKHHGLKSNTPNNSQKDYSLFIETERQSDNFKNINNLGDYRQFTVNNGDNKNFINFNPIINHKNKKNVFRNNIKYPIKNNTDRSNLNYNDIKISPSFYNLDKSKIEEQHRFDIFSFLGKLLERISNLEKKFENNNSNLLNNEFEENNESIYHLNEEITRMTEFLDKNKFKLKDNSFYNINTSDNNIKSKDINFNKNVDNENINLNDINEENKVLKIDKKLYEQKITNINDDLNDSFFINKEKVNNLIEEKESQNLKNNYLRIKNKYDILSKNYKQLRTIIFNLKKEISEKDKEINNYKGQLNLVKNISEENSQKLIKENQELKDKILKLQNTILINNDKINELTIYIQTNKLFNSNYNNNENLSNSNISFQNKSLIGNKDLENQLMLSSSQDKRIQEEFDKLKIILNNDANK